MTWFTAEAQRVVSGIVSAPPDAVRAFYVDLDNLILLHPLIVSVTSLSKCDTTRGYRHTYRVRDGIPLGPVRVPIAYTVELDVPDSGDVVSVARQSPRVRLRAVISFDQHGDGWTRITERIDFTAPRVLARTVIRQACAAHVELLAALAAHFQG